MRISDWSSACALPIFAPAKAGAAVGLTLRCCSKPLTAPAFAGATSHYFDKSLSKLSQCASAGTIAATGTRSLRPWAKLSLAFEKRPATPRSEEHTSELQSLMRISYAVFCLKKKKKKTNIRNQNQPSHKKRTKTKKNTQTR